MNINMINYISQTAQAISATTKDEPKQYIKLSGTDGEDYAGVKLDVSSDALLLFQQQLESTKEELDTSNEMGKMMEIARRIASGGRVPPLDERKLMEYSSEMYQMAKQAAMMNENKDDTVYQSLFEDEENGDMVQKMMRLKADSSPTVDITEDK